MDTPIIRRMLRLLPVLVLVCAPFGCGNYGEIASENGQFGDGPCAIMFELNSTHINLQVMSVDTAGGCIWVKEPWNCPGLTLASGDITCTADTNNNGKPDSDEPQRSVAGAINGWSFCYNAQTLELGDDFVDQPIIIEMKVVDSNGKEYKKQERRENKSSLTWEFPDMGETDVWNVTQGVAFSVVNGPGLSIRFLGETRHDATQTWDPREAWRIAVLLHNQEVASDTIGIGDDQLVIDLPLSYFLRGRKHQSLRGGGGYDAPSIDDIAVELYDAQGQLVLRKRMAAWFH